MARKADDLVIIEELQLRLREAEEAIEAIRNGDVDAIVVNSDSGEKIFSLSTSDTPYRIILEEMDEGAVIINSDGTILYSNPRLISLLSDSVIQFTGTNLKNFISPDDKARFLRLLKKSKSSRASGVISFKKTNSGSPVYLNLSLRSVPEGMTGDICIIASDVTNIRQNQIQLKKLVKKRTIDLEKANEILRKDLIAIKKNEMDLRESEERFRTIAETVPALVCVTRLSDNIVLFTNEVNNKAFGLSGDQIIGSSGPNFYWDPADRAKMVQIFKEHGAVDNYELKVKRSDGTPFWIITSVRPITYYGVPAMIGASIDITETRKVMEELRNSELRLKELVATKDKFFNIVAHDLKNPFTSLIGSSELLSKHITQMDPDRITALASIFNDAAKNGYAILENLLDWSRSQTGLLKYDPTRLNLKALTDEHIMNMNHSIVNKEIKFSSTVDKDLFIFADEYMIKTVLRNLLSNAIKFSYRKGRVSINAIENNGHVVVSVKDNGIGISRENVDKIFRIDSKFSMPGTEKELGTGLGLKLCKEFIEKQGGTIWVESYEYKGSEFKFTIPIKELRRNQQKSYK